MKKPLVYRLMQAVAYVASAMAKSRAWQHLKSVELRQLWPSMREVLQKIQELRGTYMNGFNAKDGVATWADVPRGRGSSFSAKKMAGQVRVHAPS